MNNKNLLWIIPLSFIVGCLFYAFLQVESQKPLMNIVEECVNDLIFEKHNIIDEINEMDRHLNSYEKCLNTIDRDKIEDITILEVGKVDTCFINGIYTNPCFISFDYWSDNSTSISIQEIGGIDDEKN